MSGTLKRTFFSALFITNFIVYPQLSLADKVTTVVHYPKGKSSNDIRDLDIIEILHTALQKTQTSYGPFSLQPSRFTMSSLRAHTELKTGDKIDVIFETTNERFEQMFIPIRIPIRKGILGYRIFLIRKQDQNRFSEIDTLDELKALTVGQGKGWSDVKLLEDNGFQVVTGGNYEGLFKMLALGRFDFFSRGINEAASEYNARQAKLPDLWVEESILLYYPFPKYFFVSKRNPQLAKRIEKGLSIMISDGSYDRIFLKYHGDIIKSAKLNERKLFTIENKLLPLTVPLDRKELWYNPFSN